MNLDVYLLVRPKLKLLFSLQIYQMIQTSAYEERYFWCLPDASYKWLECCLEPGALFAPEITPKVNLKFQ